MRLLLSIIFLIIWGLGAAFFYHHWEGKKELRLNENSLLLSTTYQASIAMYRLATETFYKQVIQQPEVGQTFLNSIRGSQDDQNRSRGQLYRLLFPAYEDLKHQGIQQLQFHSAEGVSVLRFHAPERFGDALFDVRPSVRIANSSQHPVFGFEIGRLNLGFRYVFPLYVKDQHVGSIETSVPFRSISQAMADINPAHQYLLVLEESIVDQALFNEQRLLFKTSPIHKDFVIEDADLKLPTSPPPPTPSVQSINRQLRECDAVQQKMQTGKPFSLAVHNDLKDWAVSFVPVDDTLGRHVAYIISYTHAPFLGLMRNEFLFSLMTFTLALAGLFLLSMKQFQAHLSVHQEKRNLQAITDTIAEGLYVMDREGRITQVNPAFTSILGYQPEELLGEVSHYRFHFHEDGSDLPVEECPIVAATSRGVAFQGEQFFRHKNGQIITVELTCKPIVKADRVIGSVTAFRDISERKAAQTRLLESDRIKSEFIATASHELRTPLAVIQGYAELLQGDTPLSEEQIAEIEGIIYQKSVALEKIVDDLLDVSRIEAGRPIYLDLAPVDMVKDIRQIVGQFEKEAKNHNFLLDLPEKKVRSYIDKFKIHQVIENLLNNAVKFSPSGGDIRIKGKLHEDTFEIIIEDQGVGIDPEKLDNVFEKFYRADTSNTAKAGFGLGLYLVKRIIEAHQGTISVSSTPGQGTSFHIVLPVWKRPKNNA